MTLCDNFERSYSQNNADLLTSKITLILGQGLMVTQRSNRLVPDYVQPFHSIS